jgi:uncharacterized SAM-binding protein YcdF (DUF218 family)
MLRGGAVGLGVWCATAGVRLLPVPSWATPALFFAVGGVLGLTRWRRELLGVCVASAVLVLVAASTPVGRWLTQWWMRQDPAGAPVQAVVVLSGGLTTDSTIGAAGTERLLQALELVHRDRVPVLVLTRIQMRAGSGVITAAPDQARITGMFGGDVEVLTTPLSHVTGDEAVGAWDLLAPRQIRRIAVVTSAMHTRRACATFEAVGFDVRCVPSRGRAPGGMAPATSLDRLAAVGSFVYEMLGVAKYRVLCSSSRSARGWC